MTVLPTTAPRPGSALTRAELIALGRSGDPWLFAPLALRALAQIPGDAELRFLLASAYARLGLVTPASEQLDQLPAQARAHPGVTQLATLLASMPDDRVPIETRLATLRANLGALAQRPLDPIDLHEHLPGWLERRAGARAFRARDANTLLLEPDGTWRRFANDRGDAAAALPEPTRPRDASTNESIYVEGLCPPAVFARAWLVTPDGTDGSRTRLSVLCADLDEALDGLSLADLREALGSERVELFLGPSCGDDLARTLTARIGYRLSGRCLVQASVRTPCAHGALRGVQEIVASLAQHQRELVEPLQRRLAQRYDARDDAWWAARLSRHHDASEPLRVMLPTTRWSTFVQHSSRDIADALAQAHCRCEVVIEPDAMSTFTGLEQMRRIEAFDPDVLVTINYPRQLLPGMVPAGLPVACWIQDAMGPLFDARVGAAQSPRDVLLGHLHAELFMRFGYPRERAASFPVLASARKFHTGPVDDERRRRFACDVAMATNHSQSPQDLARVLADQAGNSRGAGAVLALAQRVHTILADTWSEHCTGRLAHAATQIAREYLGTDDPSMVSRLRYQVAHPIADRVLRHRVLGWARVICQRRGWSLAIYGRGWESHPEFAPFHRGTLDHGEDLRAGYALARVHLHASISTNTHQRVLECALAGSLPACLLKLDDLTQLNYYLARAVAPDMPAHHCDLSPHRRHLALPIDHPQAARAWSLYQRLGLTQGFYAELSGIYLEPDALGPPVPGSVPTAAEAWLAGDLDQTGFRDERELESLLERAITRPCWRENLVGGLRRRVLDTLTYDHAARTLIAMLERPVDTKEPA